ncbi:MAG TPA: TetR/AcrR family transcriptional regulator [Azospirillum sp.]|nr:TetR/AcrR family transcriptional regulator [Azospirillum sp.]
MAEMMGVVAPSPEAGSKPAQILEAAGKLFLENGYGAVSMDAVAKTANVSKATLYAHFRSKDELFAAMVACECRNQMGTLSCEQVSRLDVADALRLIGRRFMLMLLSSKALAAYRVVVAEAHRFPELARAFYESGPAHSHAQMAAYLRDVDRRGVLRIPDADLAAEQFFGLLKVQIHTRFILCIDPQLPESEIERVVNAAVDLFTKGYAPDPR